MYSIWTIGKVINLKSVIVSMLAMASTWICLRYGITANFPLSLIATAIVFPIVFAIGHAFKRRENALDDYGVIKAHGRAIYFAARDWLPERNDERIQSIEHILGHLLKACRDMFKSPLSETPVHEKRVYAAFSELSEFVKKLREDGLAAGECSRCNQYISKMIVSFEQIKHIYQYRTPRSLNAFSDFFIILLPILYGPYFAYEAAEYSAALVYIMPVLFSIILVGLSNIQEHLEDPFDQVGEDDVAINAEKFVALLACDRDDFQVPATS
jgi:predicted membrane chloride channel (bestrophin family)